ncbi:MAG: sulfite exporter TauE/SafE family protein [Sphingomonas sp.]|uniref:sulfite exporter TauE/SafE family protein n=1 Tax=Sphingomonas sp. TaxID=28214 RepID=UPI001201C28B|nr:sulfite exporter TauE/SafE family protein [Sphingomonas sp.]THD34527.1 MAG: sulfite exporter TauE/SafE family protein [Sphingomonas sp.]
MPIDWHYSLAGVLVGLVVGLTGVGGGSLMTPLLVLVFGVAPTTAVGTDLLYASATKTVGTTVHGWRGTVDWRVVGRLAAGSVPATILTLLAIGHAGAARTGHTISLILGIVLILSAVATIFRARIVAYLTPRVGAVGSEHPLIFTVLLGAILGTLVSLTSVGAGALGMTALLILYPTLPINRLVGSDIAHAVPLTLLAGMGHWLLGSVNGEILVSLLTGSIPGIIVGSLIASRVSDRFLTPILATVLLLVGAKLLF